MKQLKVESIYIQRRSRRLEADFLRYMEVAYNFSKGKGLNEKNFSLWGTLSSLKDFIKDTRLKLKANQIRKHKDFTIISFTVAPTPRNLRRKQNGNKITVRNTSAHENTLIK